MEKEKIKQFVGNIVDNYKERRGVFLGNHWFKLIWYLKRIRLSDKYREKEYRRILDEEVDFILDEKDEIKGLSELTNVDNEKIRKSKYIIRSHILRLKYRADYLALALGMFSLLVTGGLILSRLDSGFSLWYLLPLVIAGILVMIERHLFLDKIYMYEEISNLFEYQIE